MVSCTHGNSILNRLPIKGITHVTAKSLGKVCPKLNIQNNTVAIPC